MATLRRTKMVAASPTFDIITRVVADYYRVPPAAITRSGHPKVDHRLPRNVARYLALRFEGVSMSMVGYYFGHAGAVIANQSRRRVEIEKVLRPTFATELETLEATIRAQL